MDFDIKDRKLTIRQGRVMIVLNESEFRDIERAFNKIYYREDVCAAINTKIESGDLPEEIESNDKYITAVTDKYSEIREEYGDGTDTCLSWSDCLDMAFNEIDYNDYL